MNPAVMFHQSDTQKLLEEIDRYLAAVDLFRAENCEPTWRPELHQDAPARSVAARSQRLPSDIRLH